MDLALARMRALWASPHFALGLVVTEKLAGQRLRPWEFATCVVGHAAFVFLLALAVAPVGDWLVRRGLRRALRDCTEEGR